MKQIMNTPLRYDLIEREKRNHDLNSSRTNDGNLKELIIDRFRYKPIDLLIKHFPSFVSLKVILFFRSSWLIVVTNYRIICIWRNAVGINEASFRMHAVFNIMQMLAIALTISISSISFFFIFFFFIFFIDIDSILSESIIRQAFLRIEFKTIMKIRERRNDNCRLIREIVLFYYLNTNRNKERILIILTWLDGRPSCAHKDCNPPRTLLARSFSSPPVPTRRYWTCCGLDRNWND